MRTHGGLGRLRGLGEFLAIVSTSFACHLAQTTAAVHTCLSLCHPLPSEMSSPYGVQQALRIVPALAPDDECLDG
ncbi:hypothetical protein BDP81DRAFT_429764 [Colletotrichum phormii]|uniref:Secreted protein n=1 Tax=Colletotrichum phormii TaxID=359342 RepID=A0AAI9ZRT6_9PEZI|nr:uncharacterized protein BDP81DRAFT_429764 [Colletotrichum phormii]KAK1635492.1 hypothetical protein BDP81DRAFT_429764 [Colletotrichum phormii]